ncbi:glycosyltransferase family 2 protein [Candidatus Uhrbacteria bacterium]|nr:glycosyltransferase family 2 protein [Candidatus Uhrbacteria bacterium]
MKTVAIIPAYNEEARIADAVRDAARFVDAVVVTDDCAKDATAARAHEAGAYVLRHIINRGQGAALQTATDFAIEKLGADIVVHFDADGQMMGEEIPMMIEPITNGEADIVLGSRFLGKKANMPLSRLVTLRLALLFTYVVSGIRTTDTHNGFRALSRDAAKKLRITLDRMAHASEILDLIVVKKLRYVERPVTIRYSEATLAKGQKFSGSFAIVKDFLKKRMLG